MALLLKAAFDPLRNIGSSDSVSLRIQSPVGVGCKECFSNISKCNVSSTGSQIKFDKLLWLCCLFVNGGRSGQCCGVVQGFHVEGQLDKPLASCELVQVVTVNFIDYYVELKSWEYYYGYPWHMQSMVNHPLYREGYIHNTLSSRGIVVPKGRTPGIGITQGEMDTHESDAAGMYETAERVEAKGLCTSITVMLCTSPSLLVLCLP